MFAFIIISDLFRTSRLPDFVDVYPGAGLLCPPFLAHSYSLHRSSVVHQPFIMDLQFSHRIWGHLDWQGG
jgi:hypothetical protein